MGHGGGWSLSQHVGAKAGYTLDKLWEETGVPGEKPTETQGEHTNSTQNCELNWDNKGLI